MSSATARARSNIALVKYWGKRDAALNLPARGSLSLTLDGLATTTTVAFDPALRADTFTLADEPQTGAPLARVAEVLDLVRDRARIGHHARVASANNFPTASGLASSASAFAALALAATRAAGLDLSPAELSALARRGSGSAARSIFGGFVEMSAGTRADGADAIATPIACEPWDVAMVIAVVHGGVQKAVSSRSGMDHTAETSPLYAGWLASVDPDLADARAAIAARDLDRLGEVAERSALTMHASAFAARPATVYLRGPSIECLHEVRVLRRSGTRAYATIDAGPHVKVLCDASSAPRVAEVLAGVAGVTRTITCRPGGAAELVA